MRFFTNRIPTNSSGDFSKLIEKIASNRQQVKTASTVVAEKTEPANKDNKARTNVHSLEGLEKDQNGEPEGDGESKVVDAGSETEEAIKESQVAPAAVKPSVPSAPVAAKPAAPAAVKPAAPAAPTAKPTLKQTLNGKPIAPGVVHAKPSSPAASPSAAPSLAKNKAATKVADAPAVGKGEGDKDTQDGVTKGRFPEPDREEMYKQEAEGEDSKKSEKTEKEAASQQAFIRIANLKPKAKAFLARYWKMLYPADYADAMTQDK